MPDRLDVATNLLYVSGGNPLPDEPPGFATLAAPRKAARGRERDVLFLCLGLRSRAPVSPERYAELLDLAAATFFGSPGSITSALRQALGAVNQKLLDLNLRAGMPVQGGLIGAALRGTDFYAVQSGPGLVIVARGLGLERFPHTPSRPLGLSNALDAQYFHTTVNEGEYFVLSQSPAPGWNEAALAGLGSLSTLTAVTDRLKEAANGDFIMLVGRFEPDGTLADLQSAPLAAPASLKRAPRRIALPTLLKPRPAERVEATRPPPAAPEASPSNGVSEIAEPSSTDAPPVTSRSTLARPEASESHPSPGADWPALIQRAERLSGAEPSPPSNPSVDAVPP
ncbi:MAG: hypothetical protein ACRDH2_12420, partial [Anaerolineales bacterium]